RFRRIRSFSPDEAVRCCHQPASHRFIGREGPDPPVKETGSMDRSPISMRSFDTARVPQRGRNSTMEPNKGFTRNRIFGLIGVLWGGAVLVTKLLGSGHAAGSGAYAAGQSAGLI